MSDPPGRDEHERSSPARPLVERLGLAMIALVLAGLFGAMAAAAIANREWFLGIMAGLGSVMTVWAGVNTLRRG